MGMQSAINRLIGTAGAGALAATRISEGLKAKENIKVKSVKTEKTGVDAKMAAKARRNVQQKINAIYANKELSNKAKTRRIGKVLDEYSSKGGKK